MALSAPATPQPAQSDHGLYVAYALEKGLPAAIITRSGASGEVWAMRAGWKSQGGLDPPDTSDRADPEGGPSGEAGHDCERVLCRKTDLNRRLPLPLSAPSDGSHGARARAVISAALPRSDAATRRTAALGPPALATPRRVPGWSESCRGLRPLPLHRTPLDSVSRPEQQRRQNREAERPGGVHHDQEFESRGLLAGEGWRPWCRSCADKDKESAIY